VTDLSLPSTSTTVLASRAAPGQQIVVRPKNAAELTEVMAAAGGQVTVVLDDFDLRSLGQAALKASTSVEEVRGQLERSVRQGFETLGQEWPLPNPEATHQRT
jgi:hypothetical protein